MDKNSKIYIAGHGGLVGSAILSALQNRGYINLVVRTHEELDLTDQLSVRHFFGQERPEVVFLAAAKVGGIFANQEYRGQFIYENLMIQSNVIHQSFLHGVDKLLFLGSTCIYPKMATQPMREECLLSGELEPTNAYYAVAKIAGMKMCEAYNLQYGTNYLAVMPTNIYGPGDNFDLTTSHVLPALLRKIHLGKCLEQNNWVAIRKDLDKRPLLGINGNDSQDLIIAALSRVGVRWKSGSEETCDDICSESNESNKRLDDSNMSAHSFENKSVVVELWGTGTPMREFLWSEDLADACIYLMENCDCEKIVDLFCRNKKDDKSPSMCNLHINIGTGKEISIKDLSCLICKVVGFNGEICFDASKADGTPRKLTDLFRIHALGWHHRVDLEEGIEMLYKYL